MKLFLFYMFSVFLLTPCFSQNMRSSLSSSSAKFQTSRTVTTADMFPDEAFQKRLYNKEDGSRYLYDTWDRTSKIIFSNGKELKLKNINFNLKENRFETETLGDTLFIFNNEKVKMVYTSTETFIKMYNPKTREAGFFEPMLELNKVSLFKVPELHIVKGVLNPLTQETTPDVLTRISTYFYSKNDSNLEELKLKKKHILKTFSDKKNEISTFVKDNKLDYESEEDLIKIFTYYDSL